MSATTAAPVHQPRERPVRCQQCGKPTAEVHAVCTRCGPEHCPRCKPTDKES